MNEARRLRGVFAEHDDARCDCVAHLQALVAALPESEASDAEIDMFHQALASLLPTGLDVDNTFSLDPDPARARDLVYTKLARTVDDVSPGSVNLKERHARDWT